MTITLPVWLDPCAVVTVVVFVHCGLVVVIDPESVSIEVVATWVALPFVCVSDDDDDGEMTVPESADDPVDHGSVLVMVLSATVALDFGVDAEDVRVSVETVTVTI